MKRRTISLVLLPFFIIPVSIAFSAELSGLDIMTNVDQREDGDDQISEAVFTLINKRGKKRIRKTIRYWKDYDGKNSFDEKTVIFFKSPPDVKNTGFLNWSYVDIKKDDDQWLYLPALRKVRRISSSGKEDSFMGTDFTFDDMGDRQVEEDTHNLLRSEIHEKIDSYVIESVPVDKDYMYSKKVTWLDKNNWIDYKTMFYDRKGKILKTLKTRWQMVQEVWVPEQMHMLNHQSGHQTTIDVSNVRFNNNIKDNLFSKNRIKRGIKK